jgi:predicted nucleic acid-binding protein
LKILVDTSVWIDFFNGVSSAPRVSLRKLLEAEEEVCIPSYILAETLQGFNPTTTVTGDAGFYILSCRT